MIASIKLRMLLLLCLLVGMAGAAIAAFWMLFSILVAPNGTRAWNIAQALDRLGNATTGGDGKETISARAGRIQLEGRTWACVLCRVLNFLQKDHCKNSIGK